jgi:hypothetical protein
MRPMVILLALGLAVVGVGALAELNSSPIISIGPGSFGFEPRTDTLTLLEPEAGCVADPSTAPTDEVCPRRYAFAPNANLTAWVSVRNDGPFSVTLYGVSRAWLEQDPETNLLAKPVAGLDGGDPLQAAGTEMLRGSPFEPVVLDPGDQRIVGVEFRTLLPSRNWMGSGQDVPPPRVVGRRCPVS